MPACAGRPLKAKAVGASLTAVMAMLLVMMLLRLFVALPSFTWKLTVRVAVEGSSEVLVYFTVRSADW